MKKILSLILCVLMLISAVPVMALAAEPAAKSFDDVKPGKWYYEGVMWCYEHGYMEGESETIFAPSKEMTRAMLVTVLAVIADVDTSTYTGSPFTDVGEGKWYTGAIIWANENNIANGISDDVFGYKNPVTREQLVVMVYGFMKYMNIDVSDVRENVFNSFGDKDSVHSWATEAMKWAVTNEIISGTGTVKGAPQLSPRSTATRAQVAVIVKAMLNKNLGGEYPVGSFTLGGKDISEFTIVCGKTFEEGNSREIGEFLAKSIKNACGVELPVVNDDEIEPVEGACEILIGRTNREDAGLVTVERSGDLLHDILYEMKDNYLIITSDENDFDTHLAATRFLCDVLGITYYGFGVFGYTSMKSALVADGVRVADSAYLLSGSNFQPGGSDRFLSVYDEWKYSNPNHHLPTLACAGCEGGDSPLKYSHHQAHYLGANPCLTEPDKIETIIKNVRTILEDRLGENKDLERYIYLSQDDAGAPCTCQHCMDVYRLWGGRSAPYVQILTFVSEALSDEYPNVKFVSYSYRHTAKAPKTADKISDEDYAKFLEKYGDLKYVPAKDITPTDACVLTIKTDDTGCSSHRRDDQNCEKNTAYNERVKGWMEIFDNVCMLNFTGSKEFTHNNFPTVYEIWEDFNYFTQYDEFKWTRTFAFGTSKSADFVGLNTFLTAKMYWDSDMTRDEYSEHINGYLKANYGPGWTYVREYIDTYEKLSSENCWWTYEGNKSKWYDIITEEQWRSDGNFEYCASLLDKALELCDSEEQKLAVRKISVQMKYIECQLAYRTYKASRDQADLNAYTKVNQEFYDALKELDLTIPDNWSLNSDPDTWLPSTDK